MHASIAGLENVIRRQGCPRIGAGEMYLRRSHPIRSVAGRVEQHRDIVPDIAATVIGSYKIGITVTIHICGSNRPGIVADWEIRSLLKGAVHISQKNTDTLAAYYADRDVKIAVFV